MSSKLSTARDFIQLSLMTELHSKQHKTDLQFMLTKLDNILEGE